MESVKILQEIYKKWIEYGESISIAFQDNQYALDSINEEFKYSKETIQVLTKKIESVEKTKTTKISSKLKDLLSKTNSQYEVAKAIAEDNNTFTEDILFDVWISWIDSIEEALMIEINK